MKTLRVALLIFICFVTGVSVTAADPSIPSDVASTAFTFQGSLRNTDGTVTGICDIKFTLYDSVQNGNKVGSDLFQVGIPFTDGLFTTSLDFGNVFDGSARWIETAVRCPSGSGSYAVLAPRQKIENAISATIANKALSVPETPGDFTAHGILRSSRGNQIDSATGALELENTVSGNSWFVNVDRDNDWLFFGLIDDTDNWHHAATMKGNGDFTVVGNLTLNGKVTGDVRSTGILRSSKGAVGDGSTGAVELEDTTTNNVWRIISAEGDNTLQFWFGDNWTDWNGPAKLDRNGTLWIKEDLQLYGDEILFTDLAKANGLGWAGTTAAIGRANGEGSWSTTAQTGDLVMRADTGKRIILGRGSATPDHPAALIVEASGLVAIPNLQTGGMVEANLQTPEELASPVIERFSRGDVLCWSEVDDALALCDLVASPLVVAVANGDGKPVISGVEPIKVKGPVRAGELLVASDEPGVAVAWSQVGDGLPLPGTIIGKALESKLIDQREIKSVIMIQ